MSELSQPLFQDIKGLITAARQRVAVAVNAELTSLYWQVGRRIGQEILQGERAAYGQEVIVQLSRHLTLEFGRGWSRRQLSYCVRLAEVWPDQKILHTLCAKLSWSHLRLLITVDDPLKRDFYVTMAMQERWSVRTLGERMDSQLFERTALSKKPEITIQKELERLHQSGQYNQELILKDPYILDFLNLNDHYLEKDFEDAILREMEQFLLEMGSGFSFIARQKRLQIDDDDFYIDLLFYNRKLKRLVAVELKTEPFRHAHKSQMELYLRWLAKYEQEPDEASPLGIILCTSKKQEQIELLELDQSGIHVAEYLTLLPSKAVLEARLQQAIQNARSRLGPADPSAERQE